MIQGQTCLNLLQGTGTKLMVLPGKKTKGKCTCLMQETAVFYSLLLINVPFWHCLLSKTRWPGYI